MSRTVYLLVYIKEYFLDNLWNKMEFRAKTANCLENSGKENTLYQILYLEEKL